MHSYIYAIIVYFSIWSVAANVRWYTIGDWGYEDGDIQEQVATAMNDYTNDFNTEFVVSLGDNFYENGIHSISDPKIQTLWRDVYNKTNLHQSDLGWWLVVGNHDYGFGLGEEWYQVELSTVEPLWNMPHLWYDKVWTDGTVTVHIIFIDTMALIDELNNHTVMMEWLNETLSQTTADWVLVAGHHPIFTCASYGPILQPTYEKLLPVLDYHKDTIDVYLAGHDHNVQLLQKVGDPGYFDFIVSGAAGAPLHEGQPNCQTNLDPYGMNKTYMAVTPAFAIMDASNSWLNITFVDYTLSTLHSYSRTKISSHIGHTMTP